MEKSLKDLTVEDAIAVARIIRPDIPLENFYVIRNDKDYIVLRDHTYMTEQIWFNKANSYADSRIIAVYQEMSTVDFDLVYLAYRKLLDLGYSLEPMREKLKRIKY